MTTIKLKNGSGAPLAGDLVVGEPALDLTNKRLYTEDSGGTVIEVGTNPSTINIDAGTIDGTVIGGSTPAAGSFTTFTSTGIDDNAASTAITIDGSQNVGIGTSSPASYGQLAVNGTASILSNNALRFYNSANNNWAFIDNPATDGTAFLRFATGGGEAMRIDASGNLLVGTTDAVVWDNSANSAADNGHNLRDDGRAGFAYYNATAGANATVNVNRTGSDGDLIRLFKSGTTVGSIGVTGGDLMIGQGAVGVRFLDSTPSFYPTNITSGATADASIDIGTSAARFKDLYLSAAVRWYSGATQKAYMQYDGTDVVHYGASGVGHQFWSGGNRSVDIDSSGNLLVGTTSTTIDTSSNASGFNYKPGNFLCVSTTLGGNSNVILNKSNSQAGTVVDIRYNGSIVGTISNTASSTAYNTSSDYRLKENVVPLTGATERVKQLNPSRFNFIADADTTVDGFLAHEVADVVPEAITGTKDGMRDEEYEVTPAVYEDVVIPAVLDEEGNEVEAERTEQQLVSEAVMGTRSVPDYQGIDQSKLVPLLVATIQELEARIAALESN